MSKLFRYLVAVVLLAPSVALADEVFAAEPNPMGQWLMLLGFAFIFYFMIWRPQSQRQKAQNKMIAELQQGDEVITSGGIMGRVTQIKDSCIFVEVAKGMTIQMQKQSVSSVLPKGTVTAN
ncbi:MAG: preprotein translocase subunit YajC [Legionellales bacterium]|nr:preprotein translocase subunit YajC [Legionellales bacterium]